jgi:hypothetical protein
MGKVEATCQTSGSGRSAAAISPALSPVAHAAYRVDRHGRLAAHIGAILLSGVGLDTGALAVQAEPALCGRWLILGVCCQALRRGSLPRGRGDDGALPSAHRALVTRRRGRPGTFFGSDATPSQASQKNLSDSRKKLAGRNPPSIDSGSGSYRFVEQPASPTPYVRGCRSSKRPTTGSYGKA